MAQTGKIYSSYSNMANGSEYKVEFSSSMSEKDSTVGALFAKNCCSQIPAGSTINKVTCYFQGKYSTSSVTVSYVRSWEISRIVYYPSWNGEFKNTQDWTTNRGQENLIYNGKLQQSDLNNSYGQYSIALPNMTLGDLNNGLFITFKARYRGTLAMTIYIKDVYLVVDYTPPPMYYLDLNCYVNGTFAGDISTVGTANVYINGSLASKNCTDYYVQHPVGTTYQIVISANTGWKCNKVHDGSASLSGTINGTTNVEPEFVQICNISVSGDGGTVTGGGTYDYGTSVTLTATPKHRISFYQMV